MAKKDVHYKDIEDAYRKLYGELANYAKRHLIERDNALDVVNDAFVAVLKWHQKNPLSHISHKNIYRTVLRMCRYRNRQQRMVSVHDPAFAAYFRTEVDG